MRFWGKVCPLGVAVLASGSIWAAADWQAYGGVKLEYDDNPARQDNGSDADLKQELTVGGRLNHQTRTTLINFDYRWMNTLWLDDSFDNRNTLQGNLNFNWAPVNFFSFYVRNTREDLFGSSAASDTQNNRTVRSTFETGMVFTANITKVDSLNFSPSYTIINFGGGTGVDSDRVGFLTYWAHRFSPNDQLTVNAFGQRINFDQGDSPFAVDFDRAQAYLGYGAKLSRLTYDLQFGYTWMKRDDSNLPEGVSGDQNDFSAPMYRASLGYTYDNHSLQLRAYRDITDTSAGSGGYNVGTSGGVTGDTNAANSLAIINLTNINLAYNLRFGDQRWNWGIDYRFYQQDVQGQLPGPSFGSGGSFRPQRDEISNSVGTSLSYQVSPRIRVRGYGDVQRIDYPKVVTVSQGEVDQQSDRWTLGVTATFDLFRYGFLDVGVARESRQTDVFTESFAIVNVGTPPEFIPDWELIVNDEQDYVSHRIFVNFRLEYPTYGDRGAGRGGRY